MTAVDILQNFAEFQESINEHKLRSFNLILHTQYKLPSTEVYSIICFWSQLVSFLGANKSVHGNVQMGIFSNASFNQSFKFDGYPIHLDMNTNVYVEVKGRNFFFLK